MTDDGRPIHLVLDSSAIVAYVLGSIHVGEPIAEVDDEHAAIGFPVLCVVEARSALGPLDRLKLLVNHRATELVEPDGDWMKLSTAVDITGRQGPAAALRAAMHFDCDILTATPGLYAGMPGGGPVIAIAR